MLYDVKRNLSSKNKWFCRRSPQSVPVTGLLAVIGSLSLYGCGGAPWNNPYSVEDSAANVFFSSFQERPKHLDPVRSYSSDEYLFIGQIYEPPLQYHYLKRPYELRPLTAAAMPQVRYLDGNRQPMDPGSSQAAPAYSVYQIRIQENIRYQPHPALARDEQGRFLYHDLSLSDLQGRQTLVDFPRSGSRELIAEDYVYQLKRMAHPGLHSPIASVMAEYIVGMTELQQKLREAQAELEADEWLNLRDYQHPGVKALDRYTYEITLRGEYPQLLYWLSMPFFAPMPWEADAFYQQAGMRERNLNLNWYPLGTGPYMLTENNPNRRMVLTRNPNFRGLPYPAQGEPGDAAAGLLESRGQAMPFIERAIYSLEKEAIPYWTKFLQGYYDTSTIRSDNFDQAVQVGDGGNVSVSAAMREQQIELATAVTSSIYYTGFNMLDPVIGGATESARLLRQAVSMALDFEEFISIFANGRGIPAQSPLPPGIDGFVEGRAGINPWQYEWKNGRAQKKSLQQARELMTRAGYAGGVDPATGKSLVLYLDVRASGPDDKARMDWLRKQFNKLGIQLVVRPTDYNRFQEKMRKGSVQIFQWGWNADYPDPENFLFLLYGPNGKVEYGGENAANYANPEYDRLFEQMKNMRPGAQRQSLINDMLTILRRDAPWAFGYHPVSYTLHHAWVGNDKPNLMAHNTLMYMRIDGAMRAKRQQQWNAPVLWPVAVLSGLLCLGVVPAWLAYRRRERDRAL